jgi:hypothetical protein
MNESIKNTTWYRALKVLYVWLFVSSIVAAIIESANESSDIKTFLTAFVSLILLILIVFFLIKKSFIYVLFGKKKDEVKIETKENIPTKNPGVYTNEMGQSFTEEDVLKAAKYAGELLRGGKTSLEEVFSKPSKKYGVPEKVLHSLIKVDL